VLRNIFGPVTLGPRKHRAAVPLHRMSDRDESVAKEAGYEFLSSSSSTKTIYFGDLDSVDVSHLVHDGMTFWDTRVEDPPVEEGPVEEFGAVLDLQHDLQTEPRVVEPSQDEGHDIPIENSGTENSGTDQPSMASSEEYAVAMMLSL
jgi:hypothetical protein